MGEYMKRLVCAPAAAHPLPKLSMATLVGAEGWLPVENTWVPKGLETRQMSLLELMEAQRVSLGSIAICVTRVGQPLLVEAFKVPELLNFWMMLALKPPSVT